MHQSENIAAIFYFQKIALNQSFCYSKKINNFFAVLKITKNLF